jgi:hypothetical protein
MFKFFKQEAVDFFDLSVDQFCLETAWHYDYPILLFRPTAKDCPDDVGESFTRKTRSVVVFCICYHREPRHNYWDRLHLKSCRFFNFSMKLQQICLKLVEQSERVKCWQRSRYFPFSFANPLYFDSKVLSYVLLDWLGHVSELWRYAPLWGLLGFSIRDRWRNIFVVNF